MYFYGMDLLSSFFWTVEKTRLRTTRSTQIQALITFPLHLITVTSCKQLKSLCELLTQFVSAFVDDLQTQDMAWVSLRMPRIYSLRAALLLVILAGCINLT